MFRMFHYSKNKGSTLVASIFVLSAISVLAAITLSRGLTSSKSSSSEINYVEMDNIRDTVANKVILQLKKHIWIDGGAVSDLLPSGSDRFEEWYNDTYDVVEQYLDDEGDVETNVVQSISYTVSVADNTDGDGDFTADTDNKVYLRVTYDYNGDEKIIDMLVSPGNPGSSTTAPAGVIAGAGMCYDKTKWNLSFLSIMDMPTGSTVNGLDEVAPGDDVCPSSPSGGDYAPGGDCDGPSDQWAAVTNSVLGAYDTASNSWNIGGTLYDLSAWGSGAGDANQYTGLDNVNGDPTPSIWAFDPNNPGSSFEEFCDTANRIKDVSDDLLSARDPIMNYYSKSGFGTKTVNGDLSFGTESDPEILYVKSGIFSRVKFTGKITGYGFIVVDGNVTFEQEVEWNGMVYLNSFALGNIADFQDPVTIYGSVINHNPILSAEIGEFSADFKFRDPSDIQYSSYSIDNVFTEIDDEYTPATLAMPVLVESVQFVK
ncbi:MAG: hypothetical protein KDD46_04130 [Bdellovibrionales bacterium]|nr:hypothetical protein [Bdellovibrionales bacterium]